MSALLCIWIGIPLLAGLAPYVARSVESIVVWARALRELVQAACSASNWPVAWRASVRVAELVQAACSAGVVAWRGPNVAIRARYDAIMYEK